MSQQVVLYIETKTWVNSEPGTALHMSNLIHMIQGSCFNPFSAGVVFIRQNLTSVDVRF